MAHEESPHPKAEPRGESVPNYQQALSNLSNPESVRRPLSMRVFSTSAARQRRALNSGSGVGSGLRRGGRPHRECTSRQENGYTAHY
jgi:hypothetical protein